MPGFRGGASSCKPGEGSGCFSQMMRLCLHGVYTHSRVSVCAYIMHACGNRVSGMHVPMHRCMRTSHSLYTYTVVPKSRCEPEPGRGGGGRGRKGCGAWGQGRKGWAERNGREAGGARLCLGRRHRVKCVDLEPRLPGTSV